MLNKYKALFLFALLSPLFIFAQTGYAKKPSAPIQVSISPAQQGLSPADIKPGDTVDFMVTVKSFSAAPEMQVNIDLADGAALVSGSATWTGPMGKGEEKALNITVRAPLKGTGKIKARVVVRADSTVAFGAEATYLLGVETEKKPASHPEVKKDSRGRSVMEYK